MTRRSTHPTHGPEGALERLAPGDDLLLVGSGLTMVDIALRLIDLRPQARLEAVSRTGLLPQPHRWPGQRHPLADFRLRRTRHAAARTAGGLRRGERRVLRPGRRLA